MSRITRESFIGAMSNGGEGLDLDTLDADTTRALGRAGISADALAGLAADGHHVATPDELGHLFDLIDRVDHDGHFNSLETTHAAADGQVVPTASGAVVAALTDHLERARLGAPPTTLKGPGTGPAHEVARPDLTAAGFKDVSLTKVQYFNQGAGEWTKKSYPHTPPVTGETRTIGSAGCAPTALAMIDYTLRESKTTPTQTAAFAVKHGLSGSGGAGTDTSGLAQAWARQTGLSLSTPASSDPSKCVDALAEGLRGGGVALVSMGVDRKTGVGHFAEAGGHVVVINGCAEKNGEEWFAVANPGRRDQTKPKAGLLGVDDNVIQLSGTDHGNGSVWISRAQLEAEMKRCYVFGAAVRS